MRLPGLIKEERREMIQENDFIGSPDEINGGYCEALVNEVADRYGRRKLNVYKAHGDGRHFFIEHNGKYYDAERPNGVSSPSQLPFFRGRRPRNMEKVNLSGKSYDPEFM